MARINEFECDLTGERFAEGTPGSSVAATIKVVRPDNYDDLPKAQQAEFTSHILDLSPNGMRKLRAMGGRRGPLNPKGGRYNPDQDEQEGEASQNGAGPEAKADEPEGEAKADEPEAESPSARTARLRRERAAAAK